MIGSILTISAYQVIAPRPGKETDLLPVRERLFELRRLDFDALTTVSCSISAWGLEQLVIRAIGFGFVGDERFMRLCFSQDLKNRLTVRRTGRYLGTATPFREDIKLPNQPVGLYQYPHVCFDATSDKSIEIVGPGKIHLEFALDR